MNNLSHAMIGTNGITLHVAQAGPKTGPLVILLHGFPEFWYGWRHQIGYLADAGYRVWAADQRGYNLSDKPRGVAAYNLDLLALDVIGLIDAAGVERASLVGHDWGAGVAWWVAAKHPERLNRLVILNVPHPAVMWRTIWRDPPQWLRSWYVLFVQLPGVPEALARANNWRAMTGALQSTSRPGAFTDADLELYRQAWSQPEAFTAMLNWYRAILREPAKPLRNPRISVPTLMLWGVHDVALGRELAKPSIDMCDRGRLVFCEDATHWVQHDEPDRVNRLIGEFLQGGSG